MLVVPLPFYLVVFTLHCCLSFNHTFPQTVAECTLYYVGGLTLADAFPAVVYTCARAYLRGWGNVRKGERAVSLTSGN